MEEEKECPTGYVVSDGEYIYEAVCEDCRKRYYGDLPVYDTLEEAEER
jgi:hypothetical protein